MIAPTVPDKVTSPLPLPVTVTPPGAPSVSTPCVAVSVTVMLPAAASTSPIAIALPLLTENTTLPSSPRPCAAGALLTGASFTGVTLRVRVEVAVAAPSLRVYVTTGTAPL